MPIFGEDDKGINNLEGFPDYSITRGYVKSDEKKTKMPGLMKRIPALSIVLIVLIVLLGGVTFFLATRLLSLNNEMNEIRGVKGQLSGMQSNVNSSLDAATKERNRLRTEISQLRNEVDAMKAQQRRQAETARERQTAAEARKKAVAAKKPKRP
jgi:peptidoglycan hydrolase CwlO-like protein